MPGVKYYFWIEAEFVLGEAYSTANDVRDWRMLVTPTLSSEDNSSTSGIDLTITPVNGATHYYVYRNLVFLTDTYTLSLTDTDVTPGVDYSYLAHALSPHAVISDAGNTVTSSRRLETPANLAATDGTSYDTIVTYSAVTDASSYNIYRSENSTHPDPDTPLGNSLTTTFTDSSAIPGKTYYYWIEAVGQNNKPSLESTPTTGYRKLAPPTLSASDGTSTSRITLSGYGVSGASSYNIYRSEDANRPATHNFTTSGTTYYDYSAVTLTTYNFGATWFGSNPSEEFYGMIDEVRLWNSARTASEIDSGRWLPLQGNEPGLAGYWPFEEGIGQQTVDRSNNTADGTLYNDVTWRDSLLFKELTIEEDTSTTLTIGGFDPSNDGALQNDIVTPVITELPANGTLYQTSDGVTAEAPITSAPTYVTAPQGRVIFTPVANTTTYSVFRYAVNDGTYDSENTVLMRLNISPVNDTPMIAGQAALNTNEESSYTIDLTDLTVTDVDDLYPDEHTLRVHPGNNYNVLGTTITTLPDFNGPLTVPVRVSDGSWSGFDTGSDLNQTTNLSQSNAFGDLDGDGDLDMVEGNAYSQPNYVYLNDGNGTFPNKTQVNPDLHYTQSLVLADLNGDGFLDIVAGNYTDHSSRIALGNGDGTFGNGYDLTADIGSTLDIALGDLDGDGDLDIMLANQTEIDRIYLNDGNGIFDGGHDIGDTLADSLSTVFGDVDGDGDLDIVIGKNGANQLFLNNGNATFALPISLPDSFYTMDLILADMDGDGNLDLVTAESGINRLYLGDGFANFKPGRDIGTISQWSYVVATGDVDNDGDLDLLFGHPNGNDGKPDRFYRNNGTADPFAGAEDEVLGNDLDNSTDLDLIDLDGDGYLDAVSAGYGYLNKFYRNNYYNSNLFEVTITVDPVNDAPTFTKGSDQIVNEDSGPRSIPAWATGLSSGPANESGQFLTFNVSNDNNSLFSSQPTIDNSGTLSYTPAPDANGSATVTVSISDDGGIASGGFDTSAEQSFIITINSVNDAPAFAKGSDQTIDEDSPMQNIPAWATGLNSGPADESGQLLTFNVSNDNNSLFSSQPAIDTSGGLTYAPAADASGSATVTVSITDDGGIANGGFNTSPEQTFTITVNGVNDAPQITGQDILSTMEDTSFNIGLNNLTVNDIDHIYPDDHSLQIYPGTNYTVSAPTITPDPNFYGILSIPVRVSDNSAPGFASGTNIGTNTKLSLSNVFGDLDGDGDLDLIEGNAYSQNNYVYLNSGAGNFLAGTPVNSDQHYTNDLELGDLDNDGNLDLIAGNTTDHPTRISLGNGDGTFADGFDLSSDIGTTLDIVLADLDGDLDLDLFLANQTEVDRIYLNNGDGTFGAGFDLGDTLTDSLSVVAGDVDGDNDLDIVVGKNGSNQLFLNNGDATFAAPIPFADSTYTMHMVLADMDGDTDLDLVTAEAGLNRLYLNDGLGNFDTGRNIGTANQWSYAVTAGDVDNDGDLDLLFGNPNGNDDNPDRFYLNNGTTNPFAGAEDRIFNDDIDNSTDLDLIDLDGDGYLDAVSAGYGYLNKFYRNNYYNSNLFEITITVDPVNDAPTFTGGSDQVVNEDSGPQSIPAWAGNLSSGPANESAQLLSFNVSNNNNGLFSVQPAIDSSGGLTFTPLPETSGNTTVTVAVTDNGGTANGGLNTSADQTFTITINSVNDSPQITGQSALSTLEESTLAITLADLTVVDPDNIYPGDFSLTVNDGANYSRIANDITPVLDFVGLLTVPVTVNDGTADSPSYDLSITVIRDSDGDGIPDSSDLCPMDNLNDVDGDGLCAGSDNCPNDYNPDQSDANNDGVGDVCDFASDTDNDGISDGQEILNTTDLFTPDNGNQTLFGTFHGGSFMDKNYQPEGEYATERLLLTFDGTVVGVADSLATNDNIAWGPNSFIHHIYPDNTFIIVDDNTSGQLSTDLNVMVMGDTDPADSFLDLTVAGRADDTNLMDDTTLTGDYIMSQITDYTVSGVPTIVTSAFHGLFDGAGSLTYDILQSSDGSFGSGFIDPYIIYPDGTLDLADGTGFVSLDGELFMATDTTIDSVIPANDDKIDLRIGVRQGIDMTDGDLFGSFIYYEEGRELFTWTSRLIYTFDGIGFGTVERTEDSAGQLTAATNITYTVDPDGTVTIDGRIMGTLSANGQYLLFADTEASPVIDPLYPGISIGLGLKQPTADHCTNGTIDGDETGVDCGGSCGVCIIPDYLISTSKSGTGSGTITPTTSVPENSSHTVTITANINNMITDIQIDGTPLTGPFNSPFSYTFNSVIAPHSVAVIIDATRKITTNSSGTGSGTITLSAEVVYGTSHTVTIDAAPGSTIANLNVDGVDLGPMPSPYNYVIPNVTSDHTVSAVFEPAWRITTGSWGTGSGTYPATAEIIEGADHTVTFTPNGTDVISQVIIDGVFQPGPFIGPFIHTFNNVNQDHSIAVNFAAGYTITTGSWGNGSGTFTATAEIPEGTNHTVTFTPNGTDVISQVIIDGVFQPGPFIGSFIHTFNNVSQSHSIAVKFVTGHTITTGSWGPGTGTYTATAEITEGANHTVTFTPNGFDVISQVIIDGVYQPGPFIGPFIHTFNNVSQSHSIAVKFVTGHTITTGSWGPGTGTYTATAEIIEGANHTVTFTPNGTDVISQVIIDGVFQPGPFIGPFIHTFNNVSQSHSIAVKFVTGHTITTGSWGTGSGTYTPKAEIVAGTNHTVTFTADAGSAISQVIVDGVFISGPFNSPFNYTFNAVDQAHSIAANFYLQ